ncbi:DUF2252 domain-containing protein [Pseudarthrobacter sp. CC12]|uniref:DUF2252 domain-containing protein n=1 Tax=Pseudarthrobacter sp. CC12 TaxID=3029193 RepID=UPI0032679360
MSDVEGPGAAAVLGRWVDPGEVYARGRALREGVGHQGHGTVVLAAGRPAAADFVHSSNEGRVPGLVPLRVGRMLASPFAFFRGSAGLMAGDLAAGPRTGLEAQLCGDAHAGNFGLYGTHDDRIIMDINDFDETASGPWEWDLKRLAVSLVLAGRVGGVSERGCRDAAQDAVRAYRQSSEHLAGLPFLDSWTALGDESVLNRVKADELLDDFALAGRKARKNTSAKVAAKWTRRDGRGWRFLADPPVLSQVDSATADAVTGGLPGYVKSLHESRGHLLARYSFSDVAFRVVGTGSVGLRNYLILLRGNGDEALILQAKQAVRSAVNDALGRAPASHEGQRIVHGARLVQAETDPLLGWTTIGGRPFIIRQFRNRKGEIDPAGLNRDHLDDYGRLAGALLARAHSRSIDPRLLAGYCADGEPMDTAFTTYAVGYADQTEADHSELVKAVRAGTMETVIED